jgi:phosphonate transport system substrate-binding protein
MPVCSLPSRSFAVFLCGAAIAFTHAPAYAEDLIRIGMVPDVKSSAAVLEERKPLQTYLSEALGVPVKLIIPKDYSATIEGMGNDSLDFAVFGAVAYLKAHDKYDVIPLVQRDIDKEFHSLFFTQADSGINSLNDLKGKRFAFGDVASASGHVLPYRFMLDAGIDPKTDLQWFRYTGSHVATVQAVAAGVADAGAADETVFKSLVAEGKIDGSKVRVFYTSPPFVDWVWAARKGVSADMQKKFVDAFLRLAPGTDDKVLGILRGKRYVTASHAEYQPIQEVAKKLTLF